MSPKNRSYDDKALALIEYRKTWVLGFLRASGGSREGTAEGDFDKLVQAGCPELALVSYLWFLRVVASEAATTENLTGMKPRQVRQAIGHLRKAASDLGELQGSATLEAIEAVSPWMATTATLADSLSELALRLEKHIPLLRGAKSEDSAIAQLLVFLEDYESTDSQIASLIAAITKREFYADGLPVWRKRHGRLLKTARENKLNYTS